MFLTVIAASLAVQAADWTWTLYEGDGPLVLANEIVDTPQLRTTLECAPGSGVARLSLYDSDLAAGFATLAAGAATATTQAETGRGGRISIALRTDHPAFTGFVVGGALTVTVGEATETVEVPAPHLARLQRFAQLCSG